MISTDRVCAILDELRKLPYIQLMVGDWLKDEVSTCSPNARDLWFYMCLAMHTSPLYGHLADAHGKPLDEDVILSKCMRRDRKNYRLALAELDARGIPSRSGGAAYLNTFNVVISGEVVDLTSMATPEAGVIFSRRMVRDHKLRVTRRLTGRLAQNYGAGSRESVAFLVHQAQRQNLNLVHQIPDAGARARTEDEVELDSLSQSRENQEGVQGEESRPDFATAANIARKIAESALREFPPDQIVVTWVSDFGAELILETLVDCEAEYAGKGWQYFKRILESRHDNPAQRPGNRRGRKHGNGREGDPGSAGTPPATARNPLGDFGMRTADEVIAELRAKGKLPEVPKSTS